MKDLVKEPQVAYMDITCTGSDSDEFRNVWIKEVMEEKHDEYRDEIEEIKQRDQAVDSGVTHAQEGQGSPQQCASDMDELEDESAFGTLVYQQWGFIVETNTDAVSTLRSLGLLNKRLRIQRWKIREPEEVIAYLNSHEPGISVDGNILTFGDKRIDSESMEVLCQLDLMDKNLEGWHDADE